ncbi:hypothetical protein EV126DRAFT_426538, partial [Verticillium dahliae]
MEGSGLGTLTLRLLQLTHLFLVLRCGRFTEGCSSWLVWPLRGIIRVAASCRVYGAWSQHTGKCGMVLMDGTCG